MTERAKFLSLLCVFCALLWGLTQGVVLPRVAEAALDLERASLTRELFSLARFVAPSLAQGNTLGAFELLDDKLAQNPDWAALRLHDDSGRLLYPSNRDRPARAQRSSGSVGRASRASSRNRS